MTTLSKANEVLAKRKIYIYHEDGLFYWYTLSGSAGDLKTEKGGPFQSVVSAFAAAICTLSYEEAKDCENELYARHPF